MLPQFEDDAISHLSSRITIEQHDFFTPQPVHDADAFLIRQCLPSYNDAECIQIIRAVVPALERCKEGTPYLINDVIMPESGTTTRYEDHYLRTFDFCMLVLVGGKQRTKHDFDVLLKAADPRLEIVRAYENPLGAGLLEVHLMK